MLVFLAVVPLLFLTLLLLPPVPATRRHKPRLPQRPGYVLHNVMEAAVIYICIGNP